jgi:hypothetical protein
MACMGITLQELKEAHPEWTIEQAGLDLMCRSGPWRFRAEDPDDAEREIERRERTYVQVAQGNPPRPSLQVIGGREPRDVEVIHGIAHKTMCPLVECAAKPEEFCRVKFDEQVHHLERYYVLRDAGLISASEFAAVLAIPHRLGDNSFALIPDGNPVVAKETTPGP